MEKQSISLLPRFGLLLLIVFMQFVSCKVEEVNQSAIQFKESEMNIQHFYMSGNDEFVCIGINDLETEFIGYRFDRHLKFKREIRFKDMPGFDGDLNFKSLGEDGWLVTNIVTKDKRAVLKLYKTDADFNIIKSVTIMDRILDEESYTCGLVQEILSLKNGDIAVIWEENLVDDRYWLEAGLRITRLSSDLNLLWTFEGSDINISNPGRFPSGISAIELTNGQLVYSYSLIGGPPPEGYDFVYGCLNIKGELVYQNFETGKPFGEVFSMSANNKNEVFVSTIGGYVRHDLLYSLPYFVTFNGLSGDIIQTKALSNDILFHAYNKSENIQNNFGSFFYAGNLNKVFWGELNVELEINKLFYLTFPYIKAYGSCHIETKQNTILLAINYSYQGKKGFEIMELTKDGKVVSRY